MCTDLSAPSNESGANVVPTAFHLTKQSQELAELAQVTLASQCRPCMFVSMCVFLRVKGPTYMWPLSKSWNGSV